jgi:PDZ domain-containing secreted protein
MAAPPPPPPAPPAPPQPVTLSAEEFQAMIAKFATGSTEERMTNMEIMLKALMECNFGYEIRKGQEAAAIEAYKENLAPLQTALEAATAKLQAASDKIEAQELIIAKHEQTITGLFELTEQLVELPTADPVTLTGRQKEKFDKQSARDAKFEKIANALKEKKVLA